VAQVDVLVVGGGITGVSVARDCALRGLRVLVVDKDDLGHGASGASTGVLHGGLAPLPDDPAGARAAYRDGGDPSWAGGNLGFRPASSE